MPVNRLLRRSSSSPFIPFQYMLHIFICIGFLALPTSFGGLTIASLSVALCVSRSFAVFCLCCHCSRCVCASVCVCACVRARARGFPLSSFSSDRLRGYSALNEFNLLFSEQLKRFIWSAVYLSVCVFASRCPLPVSLALGRRAVNVCVISFWVYAKHSQSAHKSVSERARVTHSAAPRRGANWCLSMCV